MIGRKSKWNVLPLPEPYFWLCCHCGRKSKTRLPGPFSPKKWGRQCQAHALIMTQEQTEKGKEWIRVKGTKTLSRLRNFGDHPLAREAPDGYLSSSSEEAT